MPETSTSIDATCPLVTKVHTQARRFAHRGYTVVLIGHAGHEEVVGTTGEAPEAIVLVESVADAETIALPDDTPLGYITQTTLSVDETREIVDVLRRRFPRIEGPAKEDICYATSNRQWAVKELLGGDRPAPRRRIAELVELGAARRRRERRGCEAHISSTTRRRSTRRGWRASKVVGVTSGASAPERLVNGVCDWFRARGVADISAFSSAYEDVVFRLPVELRRAERSAA